MYILKDTSLVGEIIEGCLRYWPKVHCHKEVMFLNELEEILDVLDYDDFAKVRTIVFKKLADCTMSINFQVSERAHYFWNNENIMEYVALDVKKVLPVVFPSLYDNSKSHWNPIILELSTDTLDLFEKIDSRVYYECVRHYRKYRKMKTTRLQERRSTWSQVCSLALSNELSGDKSYRTQIFAIRQALDGSGKSERSSDTA